MAAANKALDSRVSTVDGRTLRLEIVDEKPSGSGRPPSQRSLLTTSPGRNLSMKCFNCNKTGHMAVNCPLPPAIPTCTLCGKKHQSRCDLTMECFRCYTPGHSVKDCTRKVPLGKYCTLCTGSDHFRDSCREVGSSAKQHYSILNSFSLEWEEKFDAGQRKVYYVNKNTGESSWTKPNANNTRGLQTSNYNVNNKYNKKGGGEKSTSCSLAACHPILTRPCRSIDEEWGRGTDMHGVLQVGALRLQRQGRGSGFRDGQGPRASDDYFGPIELRGHG